MTKWLLLLIVAGVAVWWFTRDPVEVAYQKCLDKVAAEMKASVAPKDGNPVEKAMADAVVGMGSAMGNAMCEGMRAACLENRESAVCKAAMAQF